jgi:hypothetical protein
MKKTTATHGLKRALRALLITCLLLSFEANALTITAPPGASTRTNQALIHTSSHHLHPQLDGEADWVTLQVNSGTLSLSSTEGLEWSDGDGSDDSTMTFKGSMDAMNAALDGLTFTPEPGFAGAATITLSAGEQSASWRVAVNMLLDANAAREQILAGVTQIHSGVQPGRMVAYGPEAYDVSWYVGDPKEGPMLAIASWGKGRVLAAPDHQILNMNTYGDDSGTFYKNGLAWAAGSEAMNINIVTRSGGVANWLKAQGYSNVTTTTDQTLINDLDGAAVYVPPWMGTEVAPELLDAIGNFVRGGGGLFIAEYGDGYNYWWGKPVFQAPGNLLLREAGIGFAAGIRWDDGLIDASGAANGQVNAENLLGYLLDPSDASEQELERAGALLSRIFDCLDPNDPLTKTLDSHFWALVKGITPTPDTPVTSLWEKSLLRRELTIINALPLAEVTKHRSADPVFGPIPDDAPRLMRAVSIDPDTTRWHSTGLYLAPGELVDVTVPAEALGNGYTLWVSGHRDNLDGKEKWLRMPKVIGEFPIDAESFSIATPFGGAIYIGTGKTPLNLPAFEIGFSGVVEAPYFVLNDTSNSDWVDGIRDLPAPYAELKSENIQISLPSKFIRTLGTPTEVMAFWNQVVALQDELGMHAHLRSNGERINIDVQIVAGYLHAGYPVQGPHVAAPEIVDINTLESSGSWGWFHEMGHESQRRADKSWGSDNPYTFDGSVECTVNLFTSYTFDKLGIFDRGGWSWTGSRVAVMKQALAGLTNGETYASLGVGKKLAMFLQKRDTWGWETFQKVFEGYHDDQANNPNLMPGNEQEERDQWMIRFSNAVSHNMAPFMRDQWGITLSEEAANAVKFMPPWLPAVGGIEGLYATTINTPITLDLRGEALSHDGVAEVSGLTVASNGTVEDTGSGFVYTPHVGFRGKDSFSYNVTSSTGHALTSTVEIAVSNHGVLLDRWFDVPGGAVTDLTSLPTFPDAPDETRIMANFVAPSNAGDNFGARMRGFVIPPSDGDYSFWIAADDTAELWVSSDASPDNASLVAHVPSWTKAYEWKKFPEQESQTIALTKGVVVYVEALMKEQGGGDNLAVAWAPTGQQPQFIKQKDVNVYRATNQPPRAEDDEGTTPQAKELILDVMANDSDEDDDDLYLMWVGASEQGVTLTENDDGTLTYEPPGGFDGDDFFKYTLADGHGGTDEATVVVHVKKAFPDQDLGTGGPDAGGPDAGIGSDVAGSNGPGPAGSDDGCSLSQPSPPIPTYIVLGLLGLLLLRRRVFTP